MNFDRLWTGFGDYQPGHTTPVGLRIVMGEARTLTGKTICGLIRIHGTRQETLHVLDALGRDNITLEPLDMKMCSFLHDCAHTCWTLPTTVTPTDLCTALATMPGTRGIPFHEPVPDNGTGA